MRRIGLIVCGIAGIAGGDHRTEERINGVRRMCDAIAHRGPDDEGIGAFGDACLGMRRLSIIDLAGGHQPLCNESGSLQLVLNGEIYNYRELGRELERLGHTFHTQSDAEVAVHAYEEYGDGFLEKLRGMFAVALWDSPRGRLTLAIDRLGIKPLYHATSAKSLLFCSELTGLLASGCLPRRVDASALKEYFTLGFVPAPATIYEGVNKVQPGHVVRWTKTDGVSVQRYWDLPKVQPEPPHSMSEVRDGVRTLLLDAVRSHLVSDVPVGAFLSGGLDSSSVVALMSKVATEPVTTFTMSFPGWPQNEAPLARRVAEHFGTNHHELVAEPASTEVLPVLAAHFGEPFADSSALPTFLVSRMAAEHVKVVLSGDGGDELFLGYTIFRGLRASLLAENIPAVVRSAIAKGTVRGERLARPALGDRGQQAAKRILDTMLPPDMAFRSKVSPLGLTAAASMLSPSIRAAWGDHDGHAALVSAMARRDGTADPLERYIYALTMVSLSGDMLVKVDRMSMANSLEVRVPLLDHRLVESIAALPRSVRFPGWRLKGLMKDVMADLLPDWVLTHPKQGFSIPLAAWLRGDLQSYVRDVLLSPETREAGFYDARAISTFLQRHAQDGENLAGGLWALLMFELWRRQEGVRA